MPLPAQSGTAGTSGWREEAGARPGPTELDSARSDPADAALAARHAGRHGQAGRPVAELLAGLKQGILLGAAVAVLVFPTPHAARADGLAAPGSLRSGLGFVRGNVPNLGVAGAGFGTVTPSADVRKIADWVADSRDNHSLAFAVLDKRGARLYVFDAEARLTGSSLVLLGSALGDDSAAGIGERPLAKVRADERTTAAGRFVSEPGHDETGDAVVWIDYGASLAMHRVKVVDPREHRFERIATDAIDDKRISNGCVNVPIGFFDSVVEPALGRSRAIVYVLPDTKAPAAVFPEAYETAAR